MAPTRFELADIAPRPWKNGGGVTQELACYPAGAGMRHPGRPEGEYKSAPHEGTPVTGFDWRVSVAWIERGGPFSCFDGVDRCIVLLSGGGVRLRAPDSGIDHCLDQPLSPFEFAGEAQIDATLLGGASSDFNVMTRRQRCRAALDVVRSAGTIASSTQGLLFVARGCWCASAEDAAHELTSQTGLHWADAPRAWQLTPTTDDAALLAVRVLPQRGAA